MINSFLNWYKDNISATYNVILITFLFTNCINFYTIKNQYSAENKNLLFYNRFKQQDSLKLSLKNQVNILKKKWLSVELEKTLNKNSDERFPLLQNAILKYRNKSKPSDSSVIFHVEFQKRLELIPFELGRFEAYSTLDLEERNSHIAIVLNELRSELEVTKDLSKYFENKLDNNDDTDSKIEKYKIYISAHQQYKKDSLDSTVKNEQDDNDFQKEFDDFRSNIKRFEKNKIIYDFLFYITGFFTVIFFFIALKLRHFKST